MNKTWVYFRYIELLKRLNNAPLGIYAQKVCIEEIEFWGKLYPELKEIT